MGTVTHAWGESLTTLGKRDAGEPHSTSRDTPLSLPTGRADNKVSPENRDHQARRRKFHVSDYTPPLADIQFVLEEVAELGAIASTERFAGADPETVQGVLAEAGRFIADVVAPTNTNCTWSPRLLSSLAKSCFLTLAEVLNPVSTAIDPS